MDQAPQVETIDRAQVIARHFEITEQIALAEGRHKAELQPLKEELLLCDQFVKDTMNQANEQQVKTAAGDMCYFMTKESVTVENMSEVIDEVLLAAPPPAALGIADQDTWKQVLDHIKANGLWTLLNNAVNKTQVKQILEATKILPRGVKYTAFRDLAWRRGKTAGGTTTS